MTFTFTIIVDLQCCVSYVQHSDSVIYTLIQTFSPYRLFQNIEFPVLDSRSSFILYIIVYIYANLKLLNYPSLVTINLFSMSMGLFLYCR